MRGNIFHAKCRPSWSFQRRKNFGALCALLFLPFIFFFSPSDSAIKRCIPADLLPSNFKLVAELAGAALVFAILVACFIVIERLDPLPEFDFTWSDVDF